MQSYINKYETNPSEHANLKRQSENECRVKMELQALDVPLVRGERMVIEVSYIGPAEKDGIKGEKGNPGAVGPTGSAGTKVEKGAHRDTGERGPRGILGAI